MGRAVDLFVTYRFLKLLTTPFNKQEAYKLGVIDKDGNRILQDKSTKPAVELSTTALKNSYTILHKLVFNIKKIFNKVPGLRSKVGTYAAALFLLKDTFKEGVEDPDVFEKQFMNYLQEQGIEINEGQYGTFTDTQAPGDFSKYGDPVMDALVSLSLAKMQE